MTSPDDTAPPEREPADETRGGASPPVAATPAPAPRTWFGVSAIKWVFALEYMLQGLANPFQGITYQPFFRHLRFQYGLSEAATQSLFAKSYLAWSFKPVLGFFIDAYGKTRVILVALLGAGVIGYLVAPLVDRGPLTFFGFMFALSVALAGTDVAVDRATVLEGAEEARTSGRSKASTVGLNQAICWFSIYGTSIVAAALGGYLSEHLPIRLLLPALALVPALVLVAVWRLPRDRATPIRVTQSVVEFWSGLNTGPILSVMVFYFIFNFQPALGPLWNNYLLEQLKFSQTELGWNDAATNFGYFLGVLVFTWKGIGWQERLGLRKLFRLYILLSCAISLTQYLQVDPWFGRVAQALHALLPFCSEHSVRLLYLCAYSAFLALGLSLTRMSTLSLVGAVIPTAAAGSLFAGFMSVTNLAYAFGYSSGSWLYDHGTQWGWLRAVQATLFGLPSRAGDSLSINMLILINSLAFLSSFVCVHVLPDRRATGATEQTEATHPGPERWLVLPVRLRHGVNVGALL
ncbi:MAG TPA: hypothetical protein VG963_06720, partial [Polyangiaceae bacterium]|nr:hypothetical protein [Polyangiaceae bacterium]